MFALDSPVPAVRVVEDEVRELVRRRGLDPVTARSAVRRLVDEVIADYEERALTSALPPLADGGSAAQQVFDAVAGFGVLQRYLDDPTVEEIWINEPGRVFVARGGRSELTTTILAERDVRDLVERMLKSSGRRVDLSQPFVDATLPDGSRLHVVIPDITRRHWAVNIRKFVVAAHVLDELVGFGTLTRSTARFLEAAVVSGLNIIVAGGTQAGYRRCTFPADVDRETGGVTVSVRVGAYARISEDSTGRSAGVLRQEQDCRELADREGWSVVEVYRDNDVSAYAKKVVRPEWRRLLDDLRAGRLDGLVVYDLDRVARRVRDLEDLLDIFEDRRGLRFRAVTGSVDLATSSGRAMARVLVTMAHKASEDTARRCPGRTYKPRRRAGRAAARRRTGSSPTR